VAGGSALPIGQWVHAVHMSNLVCGDAYLIDGQSNALASAAAGSGGMTLRRLRHPPCVPVRDRPACSRGSPQGSPDRSKSFNSRIAGPSKLMGGFLGAASARILPHLPTPRAKAIVR